VVSVQALDELKARHVALSKEIGQLRSAGQTPAELIEAARSLSKQIRHLETTQAAETSATVTGPLQTEVLTTMEQVHELRPQWQELHRSVAAGNPWVSWEWMASWYEVYGGRGQIHCLAIRDAHQQLTGIIPCFISERGRLGPKHRTMRFASTYGLTRGIHLRPVCADAHLPAVCDAWCDHMEHTGHHWDRLWLGYVDAPAAELWPLLARLCDLGWELTLGHETRAPLMTLPAEAPDIVSCLVSANLRNNLRAASRRLQQEHPEHGFSYLIPASEDVESIVARHVELSIGRFDQKVATTSEPAAVRESGYKDPLHRRCSLLAAQRFAAAGWLRVALLEIAGESVATYLTIHCGTTLHLWNPGWLPEWAPYRVSHLTTLHAIHSAHDEGARSIDMGRGHLAYKSQYTREYRQLLSVTGSSGRHRTSRRVGAAAEYAALTVLNALRSGR
jgi:hypothetical protein